MNRYVLAILLAVSLTVLMYSCGEKTSSKMASSQTEQGKSEKLLAKVLGCEKKENNKNVSQDSNETNSLLGSKLLVKPGIGAGDIKFGMTEDELMHHFGKPERIEKHGPKKHLMMYLSKGISFYVFDDVGILSITFTSQVAIPSLKSNDSTAMTKEGIGMGASESQIKVAYGKSCSIKVNGDRKDINYEDLGLDFVLLSDKVAMFSI